ncbi:sialate:O-sulfotransferase 1 [Procambarus clarkii]|uniref:sialate:O-sulfotransferase 1 n=1 Tax=Procambarus clarkii TaxID=6728 RepID=UPI003742AC0B
MREATALLGRLHGSVERLPGDVLEVDLTKAWRRPWEKDKDNGCAIYQTRFGRGLTPALMVSVPGSGSNWLRYLLEGATGFFIGSSYNDTILYEAGFLGEMDGMDGGRTIMQRTHGPAFFLTYIHDLQDRYEHINSSLPTVLLLRDPARTIISYWKLFNLEGSNKHLDEIPAARFQGKDFHDFVSEVTSLWEELAADRLLWCSGPLYVIHYDDLLRHPIYHLRLLLRFLRIPVDEGRLSCLSKHIDGSLKRTTTRTIDPFTEDEKKMFANVVRRINRLLLVLGYPQLQASDYITHAKLPTAPGQ